MTDFYIPTWYIVRGNDIVTVEAMSEKQANKLFELQFPGEKFIVHSL